MPALKTATRRVVLNDRDYEVLRDLNSLRAVRLDDLARLLSYRGGKTEVMALRTARSIVARWIDLGLAESHPNPRGGVAIITSTKNTAQAVGADQVANGLPAWSYIKHTLCTAAVAIETIVEHGGTFVSEAELQAAGAAGHRTDGLATINGQTFAIEVELNPKNSRRWMSIIQETVARYGTVIYFATPNVKKNLTDWADKNLAAEVRSKVVINPLGAMDR